MELEEVIILTEDNSLLQRRVISQCKQEMISSTVIGLFICVIGAGSLIYAASIEEEDGLKFLANTFGIGFLVISFLFFLRILIRSCLLRAARDRNTKKLLWTVGFSGLLDIFIILISLVVILWTWVLQWLIILVFSFILVIWRLHILIQFTIECRKRSISTQL